MHIEKVQSVVTMAGLNLKITSLVQENNYRNKQCARCVQYISWYNILLYVRSAQYTACDYHAHLVSKAERSLSHNDASSENRLWQFTTHQGTCFTDEMGMTIACDLLHSNTLHLVLHLYCELKPLGGTFWQQFFFIICCFYRFCKF